MTLNEIEPVDGQGIEAEFVSRAGVHILGILNERNDDDFDVLNVVLYWANSPECVLKEEELLDQLREVRERICARNVEMHKIGMTVLGYFSDNDIGEVGVGGDVAIV